MRQLSQPQWVKVEFEVDISNAYWKDKYLDYILWDVLKCEVYAPIRNINIYSQNEKGLISTEILQRMIQIKPKWKLVYNAKTDSEIKPPSS